MTEMEALKIARENRYGQVIYEDSPREADHLAALEEVKAIRNELSRLRHRLEDLQIAETGERTPVAIHDSIAYSAKGALDCAIVALYSLESGVRSFRARALRSVELWEDIITNPDRYVLRPTRES